MSIRESYIGKPVLRLEDVRLLRGKGKYVDDINVPGMLHAAIFRSPVAHGFVRALDTEAARTACGVRAVYTAADLGASIPKIPMRMEPHPDLVRFEQPVIAAEKVRYVGEPLAIVIADTAALAEDAAGLITVDIDELSAITTCEEAAKGETLLFEAYGTNLGLKITAAKGEAAKIMRDAPYVRKERFRVHRHFPLPMETRGVVAVWDDARSRLCIHGWTKTTYPNRTSLAEQLGMPESDIDVIEGDIGGGFGMRGVLCPEDFLVPYAARQLRRAVKWIEDRREHFLTSSHSREVECELEIACDREGTILALAGKAWSHTGAYIRPNAVTAPRNLVHMIAGPYRIPHIDMEISMLLSNKTPLGSYRGPGRYEADFFRERLIDMAATDLGIDRLEIRRRNLITRQEMPYRLPRVEPYGTQGETDTGDYLMALERCLKEFDWEGKRHLQGKLIDGRYHGLGLGCFIEGGAMGPRENARIILAPTGDIMVYVGSSALGQGLETVFTQIVADALEVPLESIKGIDHGSTTHLDMGYGTGGSRSTVMGGSALLDAAQILKSELRNLAAAMLECDPSDVRILDNLTRFSAQGKTCALAEVCPGGLTANGTFANTRRTYNYGTHAAHIAIDPGTGHLEVIEYCCVEDVGRIINPATLHGQVLGAIVQGLGGTLLEELAYDAQGQLLTGSLASYLAPSGEDFPNIKAIALEVYTSPISPLGAKGAGEGGIIPVAGVISNAVASALQSWRVQPTELPLTPPRIWGLIQGAVPVT